MKQEIEKKFQFIIWSISCLLIDNKKKISLVYNDLELKKEEVSIYLPVDHQ